MLPSAVACPELAAPFTHIAAELVQVAMRINALRRNALCAGEAASPPGRAARPLGEGAPRVPEPEQGTPSAGAHAGGDALKTPGDLEEGGASAPAPCSLGGPRDGERIRWDAERLACVWRPLTTPSCPLWLGGDAAGYARSFGGGAWKC